MWFQIATITAICILLDSFEARITTDHELDHEITFRQRSLDDWKRLWHQEIHARCKESILKHMKWACDKDIYRVTRRSETSNLDEAAEVLAWPLMPEARAKRMIRTREKRRSSITNECCRSAGCTWEEYAEYCPTNKRITPFIL